MSMQPPGGTNGSAGRMLLPQRLVEGYEAFLNARFAHEQDRFRELATHGQAPSIMLIGCCDSRVPPEVIFDFAPGELFVVRNIANLVPPYETNGGLHGISSALEFAVMALGVAHIVVMGHAGCGGVAAYARGEFVPGHKPLSPGDFIGKWMNLISPVAAKTPRGDEPLEDYIERLARAAVAQDLVNLRSFPWIAAREKQGRLRLHGAYFGIASGALLALDEANGRFDPISPDAHRKALAGTST